VLAYARSPRSTADVPAQRRCSTSSGYFQSGAEAGSSSSTACDRHHDLRGHLVAGPAGDDRGPGRAQVMRQPVACPTGSARARPARILVHRAVDNRTRSSFRQHRGRQDELVFDWHSGASTRTGGVWRAARRARRAGAARSPARGRLGAPAQHQPPRQRAPAASPRRRWPSRPSCTSPTFSRRRRQGTVGGARRGPLSRAEVYAGAAHRPSRRRDQNGFERVVLGISGGSSPLAALIARDALAPERVTCVSCPPYSIDGPGRRRAIATNLGPTSAGSRSPSDGGLHRCRRHRSRHRAASRGERAARIAATSSGPVPNVRWLGLATGNKSELSVATRPCTATLPRLRPPQGRLQGLGRAGWCAGQQA